MGRFPPRTEVAFSDDNLYAHLVKVRETTVHTDQTLTHNTRLKYYRAMLMSNCMSSGFNIASILRSQLQ
jgi:hypothetical protein